MSARAILLWLTLPAAVAALHAGPGRAWLGRDDAETLSGFARKLAADGDWEAAVKKYETAIAALPESAVARRRQLEVELGKSLVMSGEMIAGQERLEKSLAELHEAGEDNSPTARAARYELATASYYAAWIMRLEGATTEEWLAEAEVARQNFRLLAEGADEDDESRAAYERSLEATIRLERMDLSELLARPKPKNCPKCKGGLCQQKRKQCASRAKAPGKKPGEQKPPDARQEIKKTNQAGLYSGGGAGS